MFLLYKRTDTGANNFRPMAGPPNLQLVMMKKNPCNLHAAPILILILILAFCTPALAHSLNAPSPQAVVLTDGQGKYPLGLYLQILRIPAGS